MNAFFNSQFSYCPLIWMCHSRIINKKINRLHERCLRMIYCDKQSSFEELLEKDSSVSIHERNIQILATEMYKVSKGMSPPQITELFARRDEHPFNLRHNVEILQPLVNSVCCGTESISNLGPKIWGMVPDTYKNIDSLYNFKKAIKKWKAENCPCRICKVFVKNIGFCETACVIIFLMPVVFCILIFYCTF